MKTLLLIFLAFTLLITLTACGESYTSIALSTAETVIPCETSSNNPENRGDDAEPVGEIEQTTIIFKPCFAFDAISAISAHHYGTKRGSEIDAIIQEAFKGMNEGGSDIYFRFLTENYSFAEIENMDLNTLARVYPDCLRVAEWIDTETLTSMREMFVNGFEILKEIDFTNLWEEHCLPLLTKQCHSGITAAKKDDRTENIISDVRKLKSGMELDEFTIYLRYFDDGASFQLTETSYITGYKGNSIYIGEFLWLSAHELIHNFSNKELLETYKQACLTDEFLNKTKHILYFENNKPGDEEEFVVALEHFVSVRNGVRTEKEAYSSISNWYGGCMPVALIVYDELMKYGDIPEDINLWIVALFKDGALKAGEIESNVESINPGFSEKFMSRWSKILKPSDNVTTGNIHIAEIVPSQGICIAKVVISSDTSYAIEVTTESGSAIFSGLQEDYMEFTTTSGNWLHTSWTTSSSVKPYTNIIPFPDEQRDTNILPDGVYYLYVGSNGDNLIGVNISVVGSGPSAEIEFLK